MMPSITVLTGDVSEKLRELPGDSVQCCVTSPPYWGLRDYGTAEWEGGDENCNHVGRSQTSDASTLGEWKSGGGQRYKEQSGGMPFAAECGKCGAKRIDSQLGLEKTPEEYVRKMMEVFREVRRVLRKDSTLWLNLGDSYASDFKGSGGQSEKQASNAGSRFNCSRLDHGLKPKDMCGIPWRVAFALQADGWYLRSDIIWAKPNPMPESVTDRPTKSHEYIFLFSKSKNYFYDVEAIKEPHVRLWDESNGGNLSANSTFFERSGSLTKKRHSGAYPLPLPNPSGRNKRSVWTIATQPYPEAHFATFPEELPKICILAGTSAKGCCAKCGAPWERITQQGEVSAEGGKSNRYFDARMAETCECIAETIPCTVLDPFAGSGTTGKVALELGRSAILIELNPKYVEMIEDRCNTTPGFAL